MATIAEDIARQADMRPAGTIAAVRVTGSSGTVSPVPKQVLRVGTVAVSVDAGDFVADQLMASMRRLAKS
jgi:hypothetical protein